MVKTLLSYSLFFATKLAGAFVTSPPSRRVSLQMAAMFRCRKFLSGFVQLLFILILKTEEASAWTSIDSSQD